MTLQGSTLEEFASLLCRIVSLELFALALHSAYKYIYIYIYIYTHTSVENILSFSIPRAHGSDGRCEPARLEISLLLLSTRMLSACASCWGCTSESMMSLRVVNALFHLATVFALLKRVILQGVLNT